MHNIHFLRPFWLFLLLLLPFMLWQLRKSKPINHAWAAICDPHLLPHLLKFNHKSTRNGTIVLFIISYVSMTIAISGPTWSQLPVPTYHKIQPRIIVLSMSTAMLAKDLPPNRLQRAKFKLHDLFMHHHAKSLAKLAVESGQWGLIAYTKEAFVVSPLTEDSETINALLPSLHPNMMPIGGNCLHCALNEAKTLFNQAGFNNGEILVLTAQLPTRQDISFAKKLAKHGISTSVIPINADKNSTKFFKPLAKAGHGALLQFADTSADLEQWLAASAKQRQFVINPTDDIPLWRDQGRWFIIPALLCLLPIFRRNWLLRIIS